MLAKKMAVPKLANWVQMSADFETTVLEGPRSTDRSMQRGLVESPQESFMFEMGVLGWQF